MLAVSLWSVSILAIGDQWSIESPSALCQVKGSSIEGLNNSKIRTFRSAFIGWANRKRQGSYRFRLHLSLLVGLVYCVGVDSATSSLTFSYQTESIKFRRWRKTWLGITFLQTWIRNTSYREDVPQENCRNIPFGLTGLHSFCKARRIGRPC